MSRKLPAATASDIDQLMDWFGDAESVAGWGGPNFRYPFTRDSFHKDCRWQDMLTFVLRGNDKDLLAFGQLYERYQRINLARIATRPDCRGTGLGRTLLTSLFHEGARHFELSEFSLFVMKNNVPAQRLYDAMGFVRTDFPQDAPLQDICYYMTRPMSTTTGQESSATVGGKP